MAKRRNRGSSDEDSEEDAPISAEERRKVRKRERMAREAGNKRFKGPTSWARRGLLVGIPAAIIVVIIVVLLFNPFQLQPPCLQFQSIPSGSGAYPQFPSHTESNLSTSWCPPDVTNVFQASPSIAIQIGSTTVPIPTGIGWNDTYSYSNSPYTCTLPIATQPTSKGGTPGTIYIDSPWPYTYTLGNFFSVWQESYSSVNVNASFAHQPINYSSSSLLGFTADASHSITLWVDNTPSNAGPNLNLDTLSGTGPVYPSCLGSIYGTGHTILLTYTTTRVAGSFFALPAPTLTTVNASSPSPGNPLYGSPGPRLADSAVASGMVAYLSEKSLGWLALKGEH